MYVTHPSAYKYRTVKIYFPELKSVLHHFVSPILCSLADSLSIGFLSFKMNRVLIVGGTGYIGKYMAKASVSQGYPTYVLVRPATAAAPDSFKAKLFQQFKDIGIHILEVSGY